MLRKTSNDIRCQFCGDTAVTRICTIPVCAKCATEKEDYIRHLTNFEEPR